VAQSTCEAEYYSAVDAIKEGLYLRQLIMGGIFNAPITETNTIWEDNQSAIAYSHNALVSEKWFEVALSQGPRGAGNHQIEVPPHLPDGG
jgi:hypothetical protein